MGVEVSKLDGFAVLAPPDDSVTVSKLTGYGVLGVPGDSVFVSKFVGYAVLVPSAVTARPIVNCCC